MIGLFVVLCFSLLITFGSALVGTLAIKYERWETERISAILYYGSLPFSISLGAIAWLLILV